MWRLFTHCCYFLMVVHGFVWQSPARCDEPQDVGIHVVVWDEQQRVEPKVYPNFPGNWIADHLSQNSQLQVVSASIHDPDKGLSMAALEKADVLVYWGHIRHEEITEDKAQKIVDLIQRGRLAMITLHSAHWSVPFMVAMQEKAAQDARERLSPALRKKAAVRFDGEIDWNEPDVDDRNDIHCEYSFDDAGNVSILVERPHCVFLRCCTPKQPSLMRVINPDHPIVAGIPATFRIPETEMYDEPFGVPEPDELILTETWQGGESFRSGMVWNIGRGKVFYFRPGDQQYGVFKEKPVLKIIENACVWLGKLASRNKP